MTRPFSQTYKQKMIERLTGKDAISARQASRETGISQTTLRSANHAATGPNQVWSWYITYLPTTVRGRFLYLYVTLIRTICAETGVDSAGLVLHSDNGKPKESLDFELPPIYPETKMEQTRLPFHGGPRPGSGRPRGNRVSHARRPRFRSVTPVHVTLRVKGHVWNLRSRRAWRRLRQAFEKARGRFGARLIEYSVQGNHLHLIIEADDTEALSRAMQGLTIRIAKALNAMMARAGQVFDDHYFARLLRRPTELVRAIAYVTGNHQHHFGGGGVDLYSSAVLSPAERVEFLSFPVGWLLNAGLRRAHPAVPG